tara:strand:+ start:7867 stop:8202 length:336 start_codon:yes stop_codon:yes gene_type:complete
MFGATRELLKDEDEEEYRYTDVQLMRAFNMGVTRLYALRPDMFKLTKTGIPFYSTADLTKVYPLPVVTFTPMTMFVVGYAELRNDEYTDDAKAVTLMRKFEGDLTGGYNAV